MRQLSRPLAIGMIAIAALPTGTPAGAQSGLGVTSEVILNGAAFPLHLAVAPGDLTRLYYIERYGGIRVIKDGVLLPDLFLDNTPLGLFSCLAFHPDFQSNGLVFVSYLTENTEAVVARYATLSPDEADAASQQILLTIEEPAASHPIDWLEFGPDGYLYISSGDGGAATHGTLAQDLTNLFGCILRVDVNGGTPYAIPLDNPFVGRAGRDEIWSYGLRNPWRCSFDRETGDLWISDVGDSSREEFNFQPASSAGGENYGWNCKEGLICHTPATGCACEDSSLVDPVYTYTHAVGCAVIGGFVYRGSAIPNLQGQYIFGDNCSGKVQAYDCTTGDVTELFDAPSPSLNSFGQDHDGEIYIMTGSAIRKLVFTDCNANGTPDVEDISGGASDDCNANDVPDECEPDCNGNGAADECDIANGTSLDDDGNGIPDECDAAADIDGNGLVTTGDLLILLGAWGTCPKKGECPADITSDGVVGTADLLILLANWGQEF